MTKPATPRNLKAKGARFWTQTVADYELTAGELLILEDACREVDVITRLEDAMAKGDLTVQGSMGQPVANPLLGELRQHRALLARLLKQLDLPQEDEDATSGAGDRSTSAREAARARWQRQPPAARGA